MSPTRLVTATHRHDHRKPVPVMWQHFVKATSIHHKYGSTSMAKQSTVTTPMEFGSFQRNQLRRLLCIGLPRQYHPPSWFLTISTVSPHLSLVTLFHATSAHRILWPSEHSPLRQPCCLSATKSSPVVRASVGYGLHEEVNHRPRFVAQLRRWYNLATISCDDTQPICSNRHQRTLERELCVRRER